LRRRVHLDLIGLPPTIEEQSRPVDVDELLARPAYGERWARHWLDLVRFAETNGYERDATKPNAWRYRDYVINAFNRDLPYDQFIIEQFAGDQLPGATQEQIVATGFLRNSMLNQEGAIDPEQFRMDAMFDRMDAIGKGILGLTIQCAQCHNHKFDPFKQEEYYRMFAFINNDHEPQRIVYTPEEQQKLADLRRQMREIEAGLQHRTPDWAERMAKWEEEVSHNQPEWSVLSIEYVGEKDERYYPLKDGSMRAAGYAPTKHTTTWRATNDLPSVGAFRLELLADPNLPRNGPGRSFMGTCALTEFKVEAAEAANPTNKANVKIIKATADYSNPQRKLEPNFYDKSTNNRSTGPVEFAIDGNDLTAWGIDAGPGRRNQSRKAVFVPDKPVAFPGGAILNFKLVMNHGGWNSDDHMNNNLGRFRLSVTAATNAVADPLPAKVREILSIAAAKRSPAQVAAVFSYWRTTVPDFKEANDKIETLWNQWPTGSTALTLMAREEPRETHVLKRGDWLKPADPVSAGVPAVFHSLPPGAPPTRLTFGKWLADRRSPTTARVFVNRMWQAYFGIGIVSTSEDFGTQSEPPSHPGLLDWLACEFMEPTQAVESLNRLSVEALKRSSVQGAAGSTLQHFNGSTGWSIKHIHRLIVTSSAYRQSSRVTPALYERDPYNRLLARGPRFRVEGEIVRDVALAASGLLNPQIGGRSTMPPAPAFLFQPPASYAPFPWVDETGPEKYRRALYTFRRRSTPYPVLQTFDVPNADMSCVRRLRSNSPLQALTSLNESIFVECAQSLARKVLEEGGKTDPQRVIYAFRRVLARQPTDDEKRELLSLLRKETQRIAEGWLNPNDIATGKNEAPSSLPTGATPTQLAAYTLVSRVLLNLDETITKE